MMTRVNIRGGMCISVYILVLMGVICEIKNPINQFISSLTL